MRHTKRAAQFGLLLLLAASLECGAAELQILVEELHDDAARCDVTESTLESRARLTLRAAGIKTASSAKEVLYINANVMQLSGQLCVAALTIAVVDPYPVPSNAKFKPAGRSLLLAPVCQSRSLLSHRMYGFSDEVMKRVEEKIKDCLGQMDYK